jgi:hypothetical protein
VNRRVVEEVTLLLAAAFAIFWAILRAAVQSLTIDESVTYLLFMNGPLKSVWIASSNNHVLNTLLMWIATELFGSSSVVVRLPTLMSTVLYVTFCYFLCRRITDQFYLRLPLFICLTYNPLVFDFMVAARGYGLADAFLLAAMVIPLWQPRSLRTSCILASVALGLSFSASFSFAFVDLAACVAILTWAIRRREAETIPRIAAFCALPGLFIALLLCGYPLAHWNKNDSLGPGAHSLIAMFQNLAEESLYQLDPRFAASGWYQAVDFLRPWLLPVLAILCVVQLAATRLEGFWRKLAAVFAGVAALSVLMHWLVFRISDLPLPLGRKQLYLVPLLTAVAGMIAAAPSRTEVSRWLHRAIAAVFICLAGYYLLCLRLTYFKEWQWDADVKDVYPVLARLNHTYGVTDVGMSWYYVAALNYYREVSKGETFPEFTAPVPEPPTGKSIYVMNGLFEREFLEKEKLVVVYRGKSTDVVIAVKPGGPVPATPIER